MVWRARSWVPFTRGTCEGILKDSFAGSFHNVAEPSPPDQTYWDVPVGAQSAQALRGAQPSALTTRTLGNAENPVATVSADGAVTGTPPAQTQWRDECTEPEAAHVATETHQAVWTCFPVRRKRPRAPRRPRIDVPSLAGRVTSWRGSRDPWRRWGSLAWAAWVGPALLARPGSGLETATRTPAATASCMWRGEPRHPSRRD